MTEVLSAAQAGGDAGCADISELDASGEAVLEVRNKVGDVLRHGDGRPFTITLLSRDSDAFMKLARQQADRRLAQMQRSRQTILTSTSEKDAIDLLVAVTVRWDIVLGGKVPESKAENYREAYGKYPALREQVDEFVGNRANFSNR